MPYKDYERHKEGARKRQRRQASEGRDIGPIPPVADPARRLACSRSFRAHCEAYHRETFSLAWSVDHLRVIQQIETAVMTGGLFATAMPRGSGKSSLAEVACLWAALNGYHPFLCLIGSDEDSAEQMLASIKSELEANDALAADYPEACLPVERLEGIANRCRGQSYAGERTRIEWTGKAIVLPGLSPVGWPESPGLRPFVRDDGLSLSSGAIVRVAGLTGGIRGLKHKLPGGRAVRPSLVIVDDPQTDRSARSPSQCESRERILAGAVLGLAGPGKKIAGIMPCTVIRPGDLADRLLDREKHPEWHGTRTKLVYSFPADAALWEEYRQLREADLKAERGPDAANAFYAARRKAMDAGASVAWAERRNPDELSAIQHAMHLRFDRGDRAFFAEYQNEPLPEQDPRPDDLTPDAIAARLNRVPRGSVPPGATRLTAFIDVGGSLLYWAVCAWEDDFTGSVVAYGSYPDQKRGYFTARNARITLEKAAASPDLEGRVYAGLSALSDQVLGRPWPGESGASLLVERCLIDANWGASTAVVRQFCKQSALAAILTPSHGRYFGSATIPMGDWPRRPGERAGLNWRLRSTEGARSVRSAIFDTNYWKSFLYTRLSVPIGSRTALTLFGARPDAHRMLADHLTAEYRVTTEGRGRRVDEWRPRPERPDNHLLDCLVGASVAAAIQGCSVPETGPGVSAAPRRRRVSFKELRDRRKPT